jgi:hypothetical protein
VKKRIARLRAWALVLSAGTGFFAGGGASWIILGASTGKPELGVLLGAISLPIAGCLLAAQLVLNKRLRILRYQQAIEEYVSSKR